MNLKQSSVEIIFNAYNFNNNETWIHMTSDQVFKSYLITVGKCTSKLLNESDELILATIHDELDADIWCDFSDSTLDYLLTEGFIDFGVYTLSQQLRIKWLLLQPPEKNRELDVQVIKDFPDWQSFLVFAIDCARWYTNALIHEMTLLITVKAEMQPSRFVGRSAEQVEKFLLQEVAPIRLRYHDLLEQKGILKV